MVTLRRHLLARLSRAGWAAVLRRSMEPAEGECLTHWAARQGPLVVTQQPAGLSPDQLALGLPAPLRWQRRRIALRVPTDGVLYFDDFPPARAIAGLLPAVRRAAWHALSGALDDLGCAPRVYGSFGWQHLTGLAYLHARSDIDLRLSVAGPTVADAVAARLASTELPGPRLDGELVFPDGSAVAWREWRQWRARHVDRILVKRLHGATMEGGDDWLMTERPRC